MAHSKYTTDHLGNIVPCNPRTYTDMGSKRRGLKAPDGPSMAWFIGMPQGITKFPTAGLGPKEKFGTNTAPQPGNMGVHDGHLNRDWRR